MCRNAPKAHRVDSRSRAAEGISCEWVEVLIAVVSGHLLVRDHAPTRWVGDIPALKLLIPSVCRGRISLEEVVGASIIQLAYDFQTQLAPPGTSLMRANCVACAAAVAPGGVGGE